MENKKILEYRVGSHLYGTNVETSDEDYSGIVLPTEEQVFGFEVLEEIDCSIHSKDSSGKNTFEARDIKFFELRKFLKLAMECNPNVIEQVFVNDENVLFESEEGKLIRQNKHLFPYKGLSKKFLGYAYSQRHKMEVKPQNYKELQETLKILFDYVGTDNLESLKNKEWINNSKTYLVEIKDYLEENKAPVIFNDSYIKIGDLNIQKNIQIKQAIFQIDRRIKQAGSRTELYLKHGFDSKFGMHVIRLMFEGLELLETGNLIFPLKDRQTLLDIRNGKWSLRQVIDYSEHLDNEVQKAVDNSQLINKPNYDKIQDLCMNILKKEFNNK